MYHVCLINVSTGTGMGGRGKRPGEKTFFSSFFCCSDNKFVKFERRRGSHRVLICYTPQPGHVLLLGIRYYLIWAQQSSYNAGFSKAIQPSRAAVGLRSIPHHSQPGPSSHTRTSSSLREFFIQITTKNTFDEGRQMRAVTLLPPAAPGLHPQH